MYRSGMRNVRRLQKKREEKTIFIKHNPRSNNNPEMKLLKKKHLRRRAENSNNHYIILFYVLLHREIQVSCSYTPVVTSYLLSLLLNADFCYLFTFNRTIFVRLQNVLLGILRTSTISWMNIVFYSLKKFCWSTKFSMLNQPLVNTILPIVD